MAIFFAQPKWALTCSPSSVAKAIFIFLLFGGHRIGPLFIALSTTPAAERNPQAISRFVASVHEHLTEKHCQSRRSGRAYRDTQPKPAVPRPDDQSSAGRYETTECP